MKDDTLKTNDMQQAVEDNRDAGPPEGMALDPAAVTRWIGRLLYFF
jgi:hypothetical protein